MDYIVKNLKDFLDIKFPIYKGEDWDHNGLILGSIKSPLSSVMISLDLTTNVINEAIMKNISMIITHHPFLFEESLTQEFKNNPYKKNILNKLEDTGISYYSLHTSFDASSKGMPLAIISALKIKKSDYSIINKYGIMIESQRINSVGILVKIMKEAFSIKSVEFFGKNYRMNINKIGLLTGAGSLENIISLKKQGVDIIVTSDIKWSNLLSIIELNIPLILISHYMENVFTNFLKEIIQKKFKSIDVKTYDIRHLPRIF